MGRRSDHTRDQIRDMAIAQGRQIILTDGFSDLSARRVARAIGYTVGTLYNIFEDFDDLVIHINAVTLREMMKYISSRRDPELHGLEAVQELFHLYYEYSREYYHWWLVLFEHKPVDDRPLPSWYDECITELFVYLENPLRELNAMDPDKVSAAARILWAGIHGICILGQSGRLNIVGDQSIENMMNQMVHHYISGWMHGYP